MTEKNTRIRLIVCAILICAGIACLCAAYPLLMSIGQAEQREVAATLDDGTIIYEDDVTAYINTYRKKIEAEGSESWSDIMAQYDFSAETLRKMTIYELAAKTIMASTAKSADISITDDEVDKALASEKNSLGIKSDGAWTSMLDLYDTDEVSVRANMSYRLLENAVYQRYVSIPTATTKQVVSYMKDTYAGTTVRLVQCLSSGSIKKLTSLYNQMRKEGVDCKGFASYVARYSDKKATKNTKGILGWDIQFGSNSTIYKDVNSLKAGEFYGNFYSLKGSEKALLFCGKTYKVSKNPTSLHGVPSSLKNYLKAQTRKEAWSSDCKAWLQKRIEGCIHINTIPEGLSYE